METLPIELLRTISLNLIEPDLSTFIIVNRKCLQIPTEHFWFQKVQYMYPDRISSKPNDQSWIKYYYTLTLPIVEYYDIYKIINDQKIKYRDCIILHPDYTWRKSDSLNSEELSKELQETIQKNQESRSRFRSEFKDMLTQITSNPILKQQLIHQLQINKTNFSQDTQNKIDLFCKEPDLDLFFDHNEISEVKPVTINTKLDKIYIITTKSYQLIALIDDRKFLINQELYPDSYYIFALSSDISIYNDFKEVIPKLKTNDEIGISYLLDAIQHLCSNIIENKQCRRPIALIRLSRHLNQTYSK